MDRKMMLLALGLLFIALLVVAFMVYRSENLLVLQDIAAGNNPSRYKAATAPPQLEHITYQHQGQSIDADLYHPASGARAAILLVAGAAEKGKDDPRLVAFASTLARSGFLVMVPAIADIQQFRLRPENAEDIVTAFSVLRRHLPPGRSLAVGMGAFSYASGPVLLAARHPQISRQVDFLVAIGGYYDLGSVLTYMCTGLYEYNGQMHYLESHPFPRLVFILSHMDLLPDADRRLIEHYIDQYHDRPEQLPLEEIREQLGEQGRSLLDFVQNRDPQEVERLYTRLPAAVRSNLEALDLSNYDLSQLPAELILIHGRDDNLIPYSQSRQLAAAARSAHVYIVSGLQHVNVRISPADIATMWRAMGHILALRNGR